MQLIPFYPSVQIGDLTATSAVQSVSLRALTTSIGTALITNASPIEGIKVWISKDAVTSLATGLLILAGFSVPLGFQVPTDTREDVRLYYQRAGSVDVPFNVALGVGL